MGGVRSRTQAVLLACALLASATSVGQQAPDESRWGTHLRTSVQARVELWDPLCMAKV